MFRFQGALNHCMQVLRENWPMHACIDKHNFLRITRALIRCFCKTTKSIPPLAIYLYWWDFWIEHYKPERRESSINERIAQEAADSWDQAARVVFVFLRCEHCKVFLERSLAQILIFLLWTTTKTSLQVLTGQAVARLAQARYPAQILIFFKLKMASPAILFLGIPRQGQVVILRPAGLQIFPRRDALGLTRNGI